MFEGAMHVHDGLMKGTPGCSPNLETYNSLITVASRSIRAKKPQGRGLEDGLVAWEMMLAAGLAPDVVSINALMLGAQDKAQIELIFKLASEHKVSPDAATYALAVSLGTPSQSPAFGGLGSRPLEF